MVLEFRGGSGAVWEDRKMIFSLPLHTLQAPGTTCDGGDSLVVITELCLFNPVSTPQPRAPLWLCAQFERP